MKKLLVATALVAASTAASAQDTKHFDGFHLGGETGYLHEDSDLNGVYFGGFAGFRKQTDNDIVFGVEGTFGKPDISVSSLGGSSEIDNLWTVMGSIGMVTGEEKRNLWSLGAGYAKTKASSNFGGGSFSDSNSAIAGFVGYERAIGDRLSLRARVTTYEFETFQGTVGLGLRF